MQSLERMRARAEDIQELGQVLDQSPRKYSLRRINSNWDYRTPPSNRKGRILGDGEAADLQDRLRRVRSNTTIGSKPNLRRDNSTKSQRGTASALGFREAEVREDMELGGLGTTGEAPFKQRLEQSRERQYRFSKKRSMEPTLVLDGSRATEARKKTPSTRNGSSMLLSCWMPDALAVCWDTLLAIHLLVMDTKT
jgi:hypothetical protein